MMMVLSQKTILLSTREMQKKQFLVMDIEIRKEWKLIHSQMKFGLTNMVHKEEMK